MTPPGAAPAASNPNQGYDPLSLNTGSGNLYGLSSAAFTPDMGNWMSTAPSF